MNVTPQIQDQQAVVLHSITQFIWLNRGKAMSWADSYEKLFRYTAFCYLAGKLAVVWNSDLVTGCVFYWSDWKEHIESKAQEGRPQFEWRMPHKGDALFVGDVIGNRQSIGRIYCDSIAKWPHLMIVPIYTLRHGKLFQLSHKSLTRFAP